jgi:hypothetical protein
VRAPPQRLEVGVLRVFDPASMETTAFLFCSFGPTSAKLAGCAGGVTPFGVDRALRLLAATGVTAAVPGTGAWALPHARQLPQMRACVASNPSGGSVYGVRGPPASA